MRTMIAALLLVLSGCGSAGLGSLLVRIEAPLQVPTDADQARISVLQLAENASETSSDFDLRNGPQFPLTWTLDATREDHLNGQWKITAEIFKGGTRAKDWSEGSGQTPLRRGETVELTIRLTPD